MADEPTKEELQEQAREAGVPVSGTKAEIAERLAEVQGAESLTRSAVASGAVQETNRMAAQGKEGGWQAAVDPGEGREPASE